MKRQPIRVVDALTELGFRLQPSAQDSRNLRFDTGDAGVLPVSQPAYVVGRGAGVSWDQPLTPMSLAPMTAEGMVLTGALCWAVDQRTKRLAGVGVASSEEIVRKGAATVAFSAAIAGQRHVGIVGGVHLFEGEALWAPHFERRGGTTVYVAMCRSPAVSATEIGRAIVRDLRTGFMAQLPPSQDRPGLIDVAHMGRAYVSWPAHPCMSANLLYGRLLCTRVSVSALCALRAVRRALVQRIAAG